MKYEDKQDLEYEKQALINLITWYKDSYHKKDFGHQQMIEEITNLTSFNQLESYEQTVDSWL